MESTDVKKESVQSNTLRVKKNVIIIAATVLCLLVIIPLVLSALKNSNIGRESSGAPTGKAHDDAYLSEKILPWLNSMRNSEGRYHFDESCTSADTCKKADVDNRVGLIAMWGRYKRYEQSKRPEELADIFRDIDVYSNEQIVNVIQTDHWACKLLNEMRQNEAFTDEYKEKLRSMCAKSVDYLISTTEPAQTITDGVVVSDMQDIINGGMVEGYDTLPDQPKIMLVRYAASVSNMSARRVWFDKEIFYRLALMQFKQAMFAFSSTKEETWEVAPMLGIAALDLYKLNNNQKFVDFAAFIASHKDNDPCDNLQFCLYRMMLEKELSGITNTQYYEGKVIARREQIVQAAFDDAVFSGKQFEKGAFYYDVIEKKYPVLENSLMLGLINSP
jgi:hypothetical protein